MSKAKTWVRHSARLAAGLAGIAVFGALGIAAITAPIPTPQATASAVEAKPPAGTTRIVCTDSFLALGRDATDAGKITSAGTFAVQHSGTGLDAAQEATSTFSFDETKAATVLSLTSTAAPDLAGAASIRLSAPDASGFAATSCSPPQNESWFAGVTTDVGATGVLVLTNPGQVDATVSVTVYSAMGPVVPPGASGIVVQAGQTTAIAVSSLIGTDLSPVLRVKSSGTPVVASLQSTMVKGLNPVGIDVLQSSAAASPTQVIPGVHVTTKLSGAPSTVLRILAVDKNETATVAVYRAGETKAVQQATVELTAGIPEALQLEALEPGDYSIIVSGSSAVVASAWQTTATAKNTDYAWFAAAPTLTESALATVAKGAPASLHIVNDGSAPATVQLSGDTRKSVTVAAGTSAVVPVGPGELRLETSDPVSASVTYAAANALDGLPVFGPESVASTVTVTH